MDWDLSVLERCLIAGRALWFYAAKIFWPAPLMFIYPQWQIDASAWWQYLFPAAAVAALVGLWFGRQRLGRGPLVAALCFAGTLVLALGFFDVFPMRYSFVADHFHYLACLGLIVPAAAGGAMALDRLGGWGWRVQIGAADLILAVLGALTWHRGLAFRDCETLWTDTLTKNPSPMVHTNLP